MQICWLIPIFAIFLISCAAPAEVDVDKLSPELRHSLNEAYSDLFSICGYDVNSEFERSLALEQSAISKLNTPSDEILNAVDIAIAKQDIYYKNSQAVNLTCFKFGVQNQSIELLDGSTEKQNRLNDTKKWSLLTNSSFELPSWIYTDHVAEFRELVEAIYWQVNGFACLKYDYGGLVFEEEAKKLEQFEDSISGTDYAHHFVIAKADAEYESVLEVYECSAPYKGKEREDAIAEGKANIMKSLSRLKEIVEAKARE